MIRNIIRDVENPTPEQQRHYAIAVRLFEGLVRTPHFAAKIHDYEIFIKRRLQLAGRALTEERATKIARAVHLAHRWHIRQEVKKLATALMPPAAARTCANEIREQLKLLGRPVMPGSRMDDLIFRAQLESGINYAARAARADIKHAASKAKAVVFDRADTVLRDIRAPSLKLLTLAA